MSDSAHPHTVADKLNWLFNNVRDEHNHVYTMTHIAKLSGLSLGQIRNLREGKSDNPTLRVLEAICKAFGVTTRVFLEPDGIEQTEAELLLLAALQREDIHDLALRARDLSPDAVRQLARFIETLKDPSNRHDS